MVTHVRYSVTVFFKHGNQQFELLANIPFITVPYTFTSFSCLTCNLPGASVLQQVVKAMARVNGVYLRELGIMFQLIANTDVLFCLEGEADCAYLQNNSDSTLLSQLTNYINNVRKIPLSSYDLGHILCTSGSGLATFEGTCNDAFKSQGLSGQADANDDTFFVNYICHEVCTILNNLLAGRHILHFGIVLTTDFWLNRLDTNWVQITLCEIVMKRMKVFR